MTKRKRGRTSLTVDEDRSSGLVLARQRDNKHDNNNIITTTLSKSQKRHLRKVQNDETNERKPKFSKQPLEKFAKKMKFATDNEKPKEPSLAVDDVLQINEGPESSSHLPVSSSSLDRLDLGQGARPKSALQQAFLSRLAGSRFRELNEELYTTDSSTAFERFQNNPELFDQYHEGFRTQVKSWPVNPVDVVYRWILSLHRVRFQEKKSHSQLVIADFGCGDAKLAQKLLGGKESNELGKKSKKKQNASAPSPFVVHSFDLVANGNDLITPCDMANVPLKASTVDVAVFVLSLMGTNIADFIREAHRVLRADGILKIAEVRSRFESSSSSDDQCQEKVGKQGGKGSLKNANKKIEQSLLDEFLAVMKKLGFQCTQKDRNNKMFVLLEFKKTGRKPSLDANFTAKPCLYKRR